MIEQGIKDMTYNRDFGPVCGQEKFMVLDEINDRCGCAKETKEKCLSLYKLLKSSVPNKEEIMISLIEEYQKDLSSNIQQG